MIMTASSFVSTVESPNKGHVGDNINSAILSFLERLSSFGGSNYIRQIFGTLDLCPFKEVYHTWRIHYRKFHSTRHLHPTSFRITELCIVKKKPTDGFKHLEIQYHTNKKKLIYLSLVNLLFDKMVIS